LGVAEGWAMHAGISRERGSDVEGEQEKRQKEWVKKDTTKKRRPWNTEGEKETAGVEMKRGGNRRGEKGKSRVGVDNSYVFPVKGEVIILESPG